MGLVAAAYISGNRTTSQPGVQASDFPGTSPPDGDSASGGQGQAIGAIPCESGEQLAAHTHAHLLILRDGFSQTVPQYVGIPGAPLLSKCIYWMHTHDRTGLIHVEAPRPQTFTLGQFFDIWGQPLTATQVALNPVGTGGLKAFVDGKAFAGDPRSIELKAHTQVVLEIGKQVTPPNFDFPAGT